MPKGIMKDKRRIENEKKISALCDNVQKVRESNHNEHPVALWRKYSTRSLCRNMLGLYHGRGTAGHGEHDCGVGNFNNEDGIT